jgi:methionine-rich copper-binding protein CopC
MRMMTLATCLIPFIAAAGYAATANAHAKLERAEPAAGSSVKAAPTEIRLWFSEPVEAALSRVDVQDAQGRRVDAGKLRIDHGNRREVHETLRRLRPGTYRVIWHAVSVDTHRTQGEFTFTVRP